MTRRKRQSKQAVVELTQRELRDLRQIEIYSVQEWGRKATDKYLDDISAALDRLSDHPEILRLEPDFCPGLYFYRVKKHFLVCDYHGETVLVLTVIHTSMDLPTRLQELEPRLIVESQLLQAKLSQDPRQQS